MDLEYYLAKCINCGLNMCFLCQKDICLLCTTCKDEQSLQEVCRVHKQNYQLCQSRGAVVPTCEVYQVQYSEKRDRPRILSPRTHHFPQLDPFHYTHHSKRFTEK